jgi:hypothetical protein
MKYLLPLKNGQSYEVKVFRSQREKRYFFFACFNLLQVYRFFSIPLKKDSFIQDLFWVADADSRELPPSLTFDNLHAVRRNELP